MIKLTIYWKTKNKEANNRIRKRFGIPNYVTINGETPCKIKDEDMPLLEETAKRGFIQIRYKQQKRKQ